MTSIASRTRTRWLIFGGSLVLAATVVSAAYIQVTNDLHDRYVCRLPARPLYQHGGVKVAVAHDGELDEMIVQLARPLAPNHVRPPVAVAIALDDSAPLAGARWQLAAASATVALIERLDDADWFSLSTGHFAVPLERATAAAKRSAIWQIQHDRVDAASDDLVGLVADAAGSLDQPHPSARERVLFVTADDRHAELAHDGAIGVLAAAARGHTVSTANAGEDDRGALAALAAQTGGVYYSPAATELDQLDDELAGFAQQPARNVNVRVAGEWIAVGDVLPGETRMISRPCHDGDGGSGNVLVEYDIDGAPYDDFALFPGAIRD